ncbi:MAG TPA: deoxyribose-phosphate aldolase [Elusimicrobiales bacterium]|nr:deoxyribose-phosphate aldolase [Elusimicrobiales bacterium]
MREEEIKPIVEAVMKALKEKGVTGGKGAAPAYKMPGDGVSIGTAGKVFSNNLVNWNKAGAGTCSKVSSDAGCCSAGCQRCSPLNSMTAAQVKDTGADRIGLCHPDGRCSSIAAMIDHTLLKSNATQEEVGKLCEEARKYTFASVCVNPSYVPMCAKLLRGSPVKVCTVIGFPLGSTTPTVKAIEARDAIANGADEIDMVINVGALKSGNDALVLDDIKAVRAATIGKVLKVIIETAYLTKDEKIRACKMSKQAGADFVKTSTGFGPGGATAEDVALMREVVGPDMGVKASGGIRDGKMASDMIKAGATRLGTSASIGIVTGKDAGAGKY